MFSKIREKGSPRMRKEISATSVLYHDNAPFPHRLACPCVSDETHFARLPNPPRITPVLNGRNLYGNEAIQTVVMTVLNKVPAEVFQTPYCAWENRYAQCVSA